MAIVIRSFAHVHLFLFAKGITHNCTIQLGQFAQEVISLARAQFPTYRKAVVQKQKQQQSAAQPHTTSLIASQLGSRGSSKLTQFLMSKQPVATQQQQQQQQQQTTNKH
jgi:hypothetical protein